ncbi:hypothetical protein TSUD_142320 [Trifolium subterraneum]|uniref:Uncharacterized protein n=1 Tax=Trifolium subterraneum TaxID=3900 RepID=A0A2Z6MB85_TRISU|nr:hypothetical protein TSUD_142320 [Trifolium subterraneum]
MTRRKSASFLNRERKRRCPNCTISYSSSCASNTPKTYSGGGGPIRRRHSTTNPSFFGVPPARLAFIMIRMSTEEKMLLMDTPSKQVYSVAKEIEKKIQNYSNPIISSLVHKVFVIYKMVIPSILPGSSPQYSHSFGSGWSSGEGPELDPQSPIRDLNKRLWTLLNRSGVPPARLAFIMIRMSTEEKMLLMDTPSKVVYSVAKEIEKKIQKTDMNWPYLQNV